MNNLFRSVCRVAFAACVALALLLPAFAEDAFSGAGTGSTTLSYYIPTMSFGGAPFVTYVSATSDKASSVIKFYSAASPVFVNATSASGGTNISVVPTGITNNNVIVVRSIANDTYQRLVVSSASATNIFTTAALSFTLNANDPVFLMTANGTIPVGSNTVSASTSGGVAFGSKGKPLLLEVDGTSACSLNLAAGRYLR